MKWWNQTTFVWLCIDVHVYLLRVNNRKFIILLWPIVIVKISLPRSSLWANWWNLIKVCIWLTLTTSGLGLLRVNLLKFMSLGYCHNFVFAKYLLNELMEFVQIVPIHRPWPDLGWYCYMSSIVNLQQSKGHWLLSKFRFRPISCERNDGLVKFCICIDVDKLYIGIVTVLL